jgi:hypothetical protein
MGDRVQQTPSATLLDFARQAADEVANVGETVQDVDGKRGIVRRLWVERGGECWIRVEYSWGGTREAPADCFRLVRP